MRLLDQIAHVSLIETTDRRVVFIADADICADGSGGNPDDDPDFQADTFYHHKGKALDPYKVHYVVVPPVIVQRTVGIVMGCQAFVTNLVNGRIIPAVVGDLGPKRKIGEISVAAAKALGIDPNPRTGGTNGMIGYELLPGVSANVHDVFYALQKWK